MHSLIKQSAHQRRLGGVGTREWFASASPRSAGHLGYARCSSDGRMSLYCVAIMGGLGAGERGGFLWQICGSECATARLACCDHSFPRSSTRARQAHSTTTGSLSSPAEVPKLPWVKCLSSSSSVASRSFSSCSSRQAFHCVLYLKVLRRGLAPHSRRAATTTRPGARACSWTSTRPSSPTHFQLWISSSA